MSSWYYMFLAFWALQCEISGEEWEAFWFPLVTSQNIIIGVIVGITRTMHWCELMPYCPWAHSTKGLECYNGFMKEDSDGAASGRDRLGLQLCGVFGCARCSDCDQ